MSTTVDLAEFQKNLPKYLKKQTVFVRAGDRRWSFAPEEDISIEPIFADDPDAAEIEKAKREIKSGELKTFSLDELKKSLNN